MEDRTIFIHIGAQKTGSTALQRFFSINRKKLKSLDIAYPGTTINHSLLSKELIKPDFAESEIIKEFLKELSLLTTKNILLSSEDFNVGSTKTKAERLKKCIDEVLPRLNKKIIVYIRRQDSFAESYYQQITKKFSHHGYFHDFEYFINDKRFERFDYVRSLQGWVDVFGEENIIVRVYEKEQYNNNIFEDFLKILALDFTNDYKFLPANQVNTALHRDLIEIVILAQPILTEDLEPYFVRMLYAVSKTLKQEKIPYFKSNKQRAEFMSSFEKSNAEIARRFLKRADGVLFYEEITPDLDKIEPYKLTSKKIKHVMNLLEKEIQANDFLKGKRREKKALLAFVKEISGVTKSKFEIEKKDEIVMGSDVVEDRTLFIHIGLHKTGTTVLQKFFSLNREKLMEAGVYYPGSRDNHYPEADALKFEESEVLQTLFLDLQASESPNFLLSSEGFVESPKNVARLKEYIDQYLPKINIKIIGYIRRQDSFIQSAYQQQVKGEKSRYNKSFGTYLVEKEFHLRREIEQWANIFGDENIVLRPYEKEQYNNNIFRDFLNILSITYNDTYELPDLGKSNQAFHRDILEVIKLMKPLVDLHHYRILLSFFVKINDKYYEKEKTLFFTSNAQRKFFLERYKEDNAILARRFLKRKNGILFYEELTPDLDTIMPYKLTTKRIERVMNLLETEIQIHDFMRHNRGIKKETLLAYVKEISEITKLKFEIADMMKIVLDSKTGGLILENKDPIWVQMIIKQQTQMQGLIQQIAMQKRKHEDLNRQIAMQKRKHGDLNQRVAMQERKYKKLILKQRENSPLHVKAKRQQRHFFIIIQNIIKTKNIKYFLTLPALFDEDWYLETNPEVGGSSFTPYSHYLRHGWHEKGAPNRYFDIAYYLKHSPEIKEKGIDPLYHYIHYGWREGKNPSSKFNIKEYLEKNPSVVKSGEEPLSHFLRTSGISNLQIDGRK